MLLKYGKIIPLKYKGMNMTHTGRITNVKNLIGLSCFGKIKPDAGGRAVFVSAVNCDEFKIEDGMHVAYELKKGTRTNFAVNVRAA